MQHYALLKSSKLTPWAFRLHDAVAAVFFNQ